MIYVKGDNDIEAERRMNKCIHLMRLETTTGKNDCCLPSLLASLNILHAQVW